MVSFEEGAALAKSYNCPFFECSAKTGYNVEEVFLEVASMALRFVKIDVFQNLITGGDLAELKKRASKMAPEQVEVFKFIDKVFYN
jgi:GTPase SAR1 family protein